MSLLSFTLLASLVANFMCSLLKGCYPFCRLAFRKAFTLLQEAVDSQTLQHLHQLSHGTVHLCPQHVWRVTDQRSVAVPSRLLGNLQVKQVSVRTWTWSARAFITAGLCAAQLPL